MTLNLEKMLFKRQQCGNLRHLRISQNLIDFASNDYLGLARSAKLAENVIQECKIQGSHLIGSTGSRLLTGNSAYAQDLENRIANFHGYDAGLLFSCGYMANVGLLSAIASQEDRIIFDSEVHASARDGIRLSRAAAFPFRHNDLEHLEKRLKNCPSQGNRFLCIESIYSTDGSKAPLQKICRLAKKYDAKLIVDEAHATGVYGPNGRGLVAEYNLINNVFAQVATFGKALGTYGAIILGSNTLKQGLINYATSYIYSTALPFYVLATIKCSYDLFPQMDNERLHLQNLMNIFSMNSHIKSISIKGNKAVKEASQKLKDQGFDVRALMSPTVRKGCEVLRICIHAFNTESELAALINHLRDYA